MKRALIVLNGNSPGKRLLRSLAQQASIVVAADGGANTLMEMGIPFHAVVGDFDSVDKKRLSALENVQAIQESGQEDTDFEKSLRWLLRTTDIKDVIFCGGMGDQFDHVLTHLSIAYKYSNRLRLRQVEDNVIIHFLTGQMELSVKPGAQLSMVALGTAQGVKTEGLQWPLNGETLGLGIRDSLHNVAVAERIKIEVHDGCLAILLKKAKGDAFRW